MYEDAGLEGLRQQGLYGGQQINSESSPGQCPTLKLRSTYHICQAY